MSDEISKLVAERRRVLRHPGADEAQGLPLSGLALSGGGIRSATFCFGLVKALAANGQLLRFDVLSTVSGGSFIGAAVGRLFDTARPGPEEVEACARKVEAAIGQADRRWFGWWLRANGRYLSPRGASDVLAMGSLMLRNLLGVHLELALLALLMGCGLLGLDLLVWNGLNMLVDADQDGLVQPQALMRLFQPWLSTWALLLPLPVAAAAVCMTAYWSVPVADGDKGLALLRRGLYWLVALGVLVAGHRWLGDKLPGGQLACWVLLAWCLVWLLGTGLTGALVVGRRRTRDDARSLLTFWQTAAVQWALVLLVIGAIDRAAWWLAYEVQALLVPGAVLLVLATTLRVIVQRLGDSSNALGKINARRGLALANVAGWALMLALLTWWVSLLYALVFNDVFGRPGLDLAPAGYGYALLGLLGVAYVGSSAGNVAFLNLSSLHGFYRGRLVRSYLGAANSARFKHAPTDALPAESGWQPGVVQVDDLHPDDDCCMSDYAPQRHGGPVHLIGICLNRTSRGQGGEFNRDRKALAMTVGPGARVAVGRRPWCVATTHPLTLGQWVAISGAAIAPGLGAMTRSGLSALATFAGARLGYWWDAAEVAALEKPPRRELFAKTERLMDELLGRFTGDQGRNWFLTDGGHFENTGVCALLRERAGLIVMADCGADPDYRFGDLENMVRKARIDHGADIRFLTPISAQPDAGSLWRLFGSLADLSADDSQACLALAQIHYAPRCEGDAPRIGVLVLIKPNVFKDLPVDLVNFKQAFPMFPQQSTSDQAFDEAQWESHFRLGEALGQHLTKALFEALAQPLEAHFKADDGVPRSVALAARAPGEMAANAAAGTTPSPGEAKPSPVAAPAAGATAAAAAQVWRRRVAGVAVQASLSVGAVAAVGATVWQAWDKWRSEDAVRQRFDEQGMQGLTERWGKLSSTAGADTAAREAATGLMAAELVRIANAVCGQEQNWLRNNPLRETIYLDALKACGQTAAPACQALLLEKAKPDSCLYVPTVRQPKTCAPRYWGRDYADPDGDTGCPGNAPPRPIAEPAVQADADAAAPRAPSTRAPASVPPVVVPASAGLPGRHPPVAESASSASASASASVPASAPESAGMAFERLCQGYTVYPQIFGAEQRDLVRGYRDWWRAKGASVPPIEDVLATARRRKTPAPIPPTRTEVRYFAAADEACAQALIDAVKASGHQAAQRWRLRLVAMKAEPRTLEVWLAPPSVEGGD